MTANELKSAWCSQFLSGAAISDIAHAQMCSRLTVEQAIRQGFAGTSAVLNTVLNAKNGTSLVERVEPEQVITNIEGSDA